MVLTANTSWKGISTTFSSFVGGTFFHTTVNVEIEIDCLDKQTNGCVELQITQSLENNERKARLSARILLSSANSKGLASFAVIQERVEAVKSTFKNLRVLGKTRTTLVEVLMSNVHQTTSVRPVFKDKN